MPVEKGLCFPEPEQGRCLIRVVPVGGVVMARNFRVSARRCGDSFHLALRGDFDGTSACELLNLLNKKCHAARKAVIHTGGLRHVYGFGRDTFQRNVYTLKRAGLQLIFCGENAEEIAPERDVIL